MTTRTGSARRNGGGQRDRLLVTVTLNANQLRAHLEPITDLETVEQITLVADVAGPQMPKLRTIVPPALLTRLLGRALGKFVVTLAVALWERPAWVLGYNLVPHGLTAVTVARLSRRRSLIHLIGGPREWVGGGWTSDNKVLGRLTRPVRLIERMLLHGIRRADALAVMGSQAREQLIDSGCAAERVSVVPAAVDLERFSRPRVQPPRYDVVCVSQLIPRKRVADLLSAVRVLTSQHPRLRVAIAGRGALEADLRAEAHRLGIEDNVEFLGFVADVERLYAESAVFVLPSRSEGLAIAMCEAMAAGVAVVSTDVGEARDVVVPGVNGELVAVGDVEGLARTVAALLDDDARREAMGRAARATIQGHCSRERVRAVNERLLLREG
jgi:glycosyltransferase involved in cell wall biosynthesis